MFCASRIRSIKIPKFCAPVQHTKFPSITQITPCRNINTFIVSKDRAHATKRIRALYRESLRMLPWVKTFYFVINPVEEMRDVVKSEFRKFPPHLPVMVLDRLAATGEEELEEAFMGHKQTAQVGDFFRPNRRDLSIPDARRFEGVLEKQEAIDLQVANIKANLGYMEKHPEHLERIKAERAEHRLLED